MSDREHIEIPSTTEEVKQLYDENASLYARCEPIAEVLGLRRIRRRLIQRASGDVLEVAVGTGTNLPFYSEDCRIMAVDVSEAMLERARERARQIGRDVSFRRMDAQHLEFEDDRFDTVVSTMTLCTFTDPVGALLEMNRVCRPDGLILLMEHGRSSSSFLARWQDRRAKTHAAQFGCHWNREPLEIVKDAGLEVIEAHRRFFGIFHEIVAHTVPVHESK